MKPLTYGQRMGLLALFCACSLFVLSSRLFTLQVVNHEEWLARADRLRSGWRTVRPKRGAILDVDGAILAQDAAGFELAVLALAWRQKRHQCDHCGKVYYEQIRRCSRCREEDRVHPADRRDLAPVARLLKIPVAGLRTRIERRVARVEKEVQRLLKGLTGRKRRVQEAELW